VAYVADGTELRVGVDKGTKLGGIPGAAVHNFRYPPRNIAQREWAGIDEDHVGRCLEVIGEHAQAELGAP
jgi:hypothetical protein